MNALIALLHFCEVHGPSVVFCTQVIHDAQSPTTAPEPNPTTNHNNNASTTTNGLEIPKPFSAKCAGQGETLQTDSVPSSIAADLPTPPSTATSPRVSPPSLSSLQRSPKSTSCPACSAQMPTVLCTKDAAPQEAKMMRTCDDEDPSVQYVGTKTPQQLHLYKAVRLACVRSLTTEFCPGRDGPVLFGDDENGYIMSYMFKLRDAQARGEARFYSLMMLMTDRVYLISCWPFIVSSFRSMAINLQEKADAIFQREKETRERIPYAPFSNSRRVAPMSQEQFFRRRSNTALRSLVDLLGIKDIYAQIHAQFSHILKLSARRRMEKLAPGRRASSTYLKMRAEHQAKRNEAEKVKTTAPAAGTATFPTSKAPSTRTMSSATAGLRCIKEEQASITSSATTTHGLSIN